MLRKPFVQRALPKLPPALLLILRTMDRTIARQLVASGLLTAASALLTGLAPAALKSTVDAALAPATVPEQLGSRTEQLALFGGAYLFCLCIGRIASEARPAVSGSGEQRLYAAIRLGFLRHVLDLPLRFHLHQASGSLPHVLQQAISGCQIALLSASTGIVPVVVEGITVAAVLTSLHQPLLILAFAVAAVLYLTVMATRTRRLGAAARAVSAASTLSNGIMADSFTNIEPIKCFGAEGATVTHYAAALATLESRWRDLLLHRLHTGVATTAIFAASMCVTLILAVQALRDGRLTIGGLVLVSVYLAQMTRPLELLAAASRDLSQGFAFMGPLVAILEEPTEDRGPSRPNAEQSAPPMPIGPNAAVTTPEALRASRAPALRFQGIRLAFDSGRPVLDGLDLQIGASRSLGIVGASGCGKSSLMRLLLRLHAPQAGSILVDDVPIDTLPLATLRSMIAVVPQDTVLFNSTISANIAVGKEDATQADIAAAARLAGLERFVASMPSGFDTPIGERGLKLSGGERQRIAIARAVLRDPAIYVFDEATSMLDGPTERAILSQLTAISTGRTTIVIAHRLSAVLHLDEIAVIADGVVAERGNHAALLAANGLYAAMWRTQTPSDAR